MFLATFFTISDANITSIIGYAGDLIGNAMPLIVVVVGIIIGLIILRVILRLIR